MRVDLFDFDLPEALIALRPAVPRDAARLLVAAPDGALADLAVRDLPSLLGAGDTLVLNDTKVIKARLTGTRERPESTARIEAMLHTRQGPDRWRALARPAKRLRVGDTIRFSAIEAGSSPVCSAEQLEAQVEDIGASGDIGLRFSLTGAFLDAAIAGLGRIPLPPYIEGKRHADMQDAADYQTAYARVEGAVAAPTAGLHFTDELFAELTAAGIARELVTLHVGAGTFLPVKVDDTDDHRMHAEWGTITPETAAAMNATRARGGRIVAVGTTSLRLLESAADPDGTIQPFEGWTDIFITPGYRFRAVDVLMTNFHLPRSTLFMLVSAFAGFERMRGVYEHAIRSGYRFYSYGDSSLIFPEPKDPA